MQTKCTRRFLCLWEQKNCGFLCWSWAEGPCLLWPAGGSIEMTKQVRDIIFKAAELQLNIHFIMFETSVVSWGSYRNVNNKTSYKATFIRKSLWHRAFNVSWTFKVNQHHNLWERNVSSMRWYLMLEMPLIASSPLALSCTHAPVSPEQRRHSHRVAMETSETHTPRVRDGERERDNNERHVERER